MERLYSFTIILVIFFFLLTAGYQRLRRGEIVWHWLLWITNNLVWILYTIFTTIAGTFDTDVSRWWFALTYFQIFVTLSLDWFILNPSNIERIRRIVGVG